MSAPTTLAQFRWVIQCQVVEVGRTFERPDDDWAPVGFLQTPEGLGLLALDPEFFESGLGKDALAEALRVAIAETGAIRYAVLLNIWRAEAEGVEDVEEVASEQVDVKDMPGAFEALFLIVGDAETEEHWGARILRDGRRPPTLAPWTPQAGTPETRDVTMSGRFVDLGEHLRRPR